MNVKNIRLLNQQLVAPLFADVLHWQGSMPKGDLLCRCAERGLTDDAFRSKAFSNNGLFYPVVLRKGLVVGNWHPKRPAASFFLPDDEEDVAEALERYRTIMSK